MLAGADPSERNGLSLVARPHLVWARAIEVAEEFEQSELFMVVFDLLRAAGHDVVTMADAMVLASAHVGEHPRDLVARRAVGLLRRALVFLGGDPGPLGLAGGDSVGIAVGDLEGERGQADGHVFRALG